MRYGNESYKNAVSMSGVGPAGTFERELSGWKYLIAPQLVQRIVDVVLRPQIALQEQLAMIGPVSAPKSTLNDYVDFRITENFREA